MKLSREELLSLAGASDFRTETLEKAVHLLGLLNALSVHPFLKGRWVLKGGTALNLFEFEVPRLSVDIDINYIGSSELAVMQSERPKIEQSIQAVCQHEGFSIRQMPGEHAGGKWNLRFRSEAAQEGNLSLDVNFVYRLPLWPIRTMDSHNLGSYGAIGIPVLDLHELAAGKLAALFGRHQARDLFDAHRLLSQREFETQKLRTAFVLYGAMNPVDWRTITSDSIGFEPDELVQSLFPVINQSFFSGEVKREDFGARLVQETKEALKILLPLRAEEMEFLDLLKNNGVIEPSLLAVDNDLQLKILKQPLLQWEARKAKQHRGMIP